MKTADISELVAASDNAVLQEINERASLPAIGNWIIGLGIVFFFTIFRFGIFWTWLPVVACIVLGILIARGDKQNRTTPIFYDMDTQSAANYEAICESLRHLSSSQKIWRINAQQGNSDWKRNAGAGFLIKRAIAGVLQQNPPCIRTNIKIYGISAGAVEFYFLPEHILVRQQGKYAALSYDSVSVNSFSTSFIESEAVPRDAKQISQTWQYVNKKGGPDRRFNNNRQLPVMQYGELTIEASSGLNAIFHISNLEAATNFSETFERLKRQKAFSYQNEKVR